MRRTIAIQPYYMGKLALAGTNESLQRLDELVKEDNPNANACKFSHLPPLSSLIHFIMLASLPFVASK